MVGLFVVAPNAVRLILSEEWLPCVPYLRIYCITFLFYPIHTANLNSIKAVGKSDLFLKLEFYKVFVCVILLAISFKFGLMAIAYSLIISSFLCQLINAWPNKKLIDYSYLQQFHDILPYLLYSIFMGCAVFAFGYLKIDYRLILLIQVVFGSAFYLFINFLMKPEAYLNLVKMIKR